MSEFFSDLTPWIGSDAVTVCSPYDPERLLPPWPEEEAAANAANAAAAAANAAADAATTTTVDAAGAAPTTAASMEDAGNGGNSNSTNSTSTTRTAQTILPTPPSPPIFISPTTGIRHRLVNFDPVDGHTRTRPPRGRRIVQVLARGGRWVDVPRSLRADNDNAGRVGKGGKGGRGGKGGGACERGRCYECPPFLVLSDGEDCVTVFLTPPSSLTSSAVHNGNTERSDDGRHAGSVRQAVRPLPPIELSRFCTRGAIVRVCGWRYTTVMRGAGVHYRHLTSSSIAVGTAGRSSSNEGNNNSRPSSLLPSNHHQQISAGLKRKFQPPTRRNAGANGGNANGGGSGIGKNTSMISRKVCGGATGGGGVSARPSGRSNKNNNEDEEELPEELQGLDKELVSKIMNEIVDSGESVTFDDIAGLADAKQTVLELVCWPMKRPDLFTGLRRGPNGLLLYGPPGTGKTLVGKAIAHESGATFFSISSSSLTSKWIGEGEKLVRTLFAVAAYKEPAVVFIDEIDSLLTARKADENEASRRIKTEFLVQLDGTGTSGQGRLLCIGATNRPHELDDAARRRFVKRLYIPLPEQSDREVLLRTLLKKNAHCLSDKEIAKLSSATAGYSGADLKALCNDASMGPIRDLGPNAMEVASSDVPPISYKHFRRSLKGMNPSVSKEDLDDYIKFNETYGTGHKKTDDDDDDSSDDSD